MMEVAQLNPDPPEAALEAVHELEQLVQEGVVTEIAVVGINLRGQTTLLHSPISNVFTVIGGLHALAQKLGVRHVESIRSEFAE